MSMKQKREMRIPKDMNLKEMNVSKQMSMSRESGLNGHVGHLYMQTNQVKNRIVHYHRSANGTLTEVERVATGDAGSGVFKPISGQESAPNSFEGAGSVTLSPDRKFLFTTNGGGNSVSSFSVAEDGRLTLIDVKATGNPVEGRSGTAKSVAYCPSKNTLFVLHSFGPDHVRLMSVDSQGKLTPRPERYTVNTHDKPNRVSTMVAVSPNEKFLFVGTVFDEPMPQHESRRLAYPVGPAARRLAAINRFKCARSGRSSRIPDPRGRRARNTQVPRFQGRISFLYRFPAQQAGHVRPGRSRRRRLRHRNHR